MLPVTGRRNTQGTESGADSEKANHPHVYSFIKRKASDVLSMATTSSSLAMTPHAIEQNHYD